ncbi:riboflavin kinase [Mycoplasma yeatsii]|uniref:riboflavin kinase n=1 Tax=Mycoplasma yeatsii TaxID=51365 RepID=UPI0005B2403A|nr:riboflavin kinase [Mycoplasma yeatsii]AJM71732.1 riboflavin kinase/FAD synthetase family protein [Mycoplasma yeatsii GM274B]
MNKVCLFADSKYLTKHFLDKFNKNELIIFTYNQNNDNFDYICSNHQLNLFKNDGYQIVEIDDKKDFKSLVDQFNVTEIYSLKSFSKLDKLVEVFPNTIIEDDLDLIAKSKEFLINANSVEFKKLTGFNYTFSGIVTLCNQLGRTINFPTANILTNPTLKIKSGVYLVKCIIDDHIVKYGMGDNWINRNNLMVFEANIFDFDKDIYSKKITFEILKYIRENKKINSLDELVELLENDRSTCLKLLEDNYE